MNFSKALCKQARTLTHSRYTKKLLLASFRPSEARRFTLAANQSHVLYHQIWKGKYQIRRYTDDRPFFFCGKEDFVHLSGNTHDRTGCETLLQSCLILTGSICRSQVATQLGFKDTLVFHAHCK